MLLIVEGVSFDPDGGAIIDLGVGNEIIDLFFR